MVIYKSTKVIELGSCAFRQWRAVHSHCRFLHGYRLIAKFTFACDSLDERNWVVDFGGLDRLKKILENQFDHTLCVAADDPLLSKFQDLHQAGGCDLRIMDSVGIEKTAEFCLKEADSFVRNITNNRCWVEDVEVWEHEKNSSIVKVGNNTHNIFVKEHTEQLPAIASSNTQQPKANTVKPVSLNNPKTVGLTNPFAGTSWGV